MEINSKKMIENIHMLATSEMPHLSNPSSKKKSSGNWKLFKLYLKQHIKTSGTHQKQIYNFKASIREEERLKINEPNIHLKKV